MLRFAGGLHIVGGRIVDRGRARHRRPRPAGCARTSPRSSATPARCRRAPPAGCARATATSCGCVKDGEALARQTGLRRRARPAGARPAAAVVNGGSCDAEAAWRGAFLAHGSLTEPGRSSALEVTCPGPEAALALVGAARRLGIPAKAREVRGVDRVVIRDGDAIGALLTRLGAHERVLAWEERRMRREVRATANRLANFDDANLRRSARAAVAAGARVDARAGDPRRRRARPPRRRPAGCGWSTSRPRLEELGALADPPMTKDAVAGPDPPAAGHGGQARGGARHPRHRGRDHGRDARRRLSRNAVSPGRCAAYSRVRARQSKRLAAVR